MRGREPHAPTICYLPRRGAKCRKTFRNQPWWLQMRAVIASSPYLLLTPFGQKVSTESPPNHWRGSEWCRALLFGGSPFPLAYRVFATVGSNLQRGRPRIVICRRGLRNGWESGFSEKSFHACDIRPGDSQPAQRRPRVVPVMVTHQKRGVSPPRRPHHILAE